MFTTELTRILALWTPGWPEMLVILVALLIIFGRRLPEVARNLGKSLTEFKKGIKETKDDVEDAVNDQDSDTPPKKDN